MVDLFVEEASDFYAGQFVKRTYFCNYFFGSLYLHAIVIHFLFPRFRDGVYESIIFKLQVPVRSNMLFYLFKTNESTIDP